MSASNLTDEELLILANVWESLRQDSAKSGLFIFEKFFAEYPDEAARFEFAKDRYGNIDPRLMQSPKMRDHSLKFMDALDAGWDRE